MKVVIIEDEHYAAEKLKKELQTLNDQIEVLQVIDSCAGCIEYFDKNNNSDYDLVFSDIHLSDGLCFNVLDRIEITSPIVFTTAYDKYALQAFDANGIDYLLKPIQSDRLQQALDKFDQLKSSNSNADLYTHLKQLLQTPKATYKERFLCKLGNKIKSVPVDTINYFYSKDKMTFLVDADHSRYPVNHTLDEIEKMLNPKDFFRVNRQYITNYKSISEIHPYFKGRLKIKLTPAHDDDIVVSTERSPLMKAWLDR